MVSECSTDRHGKSSSDRKGDGGVYAAWRTYRSILVIGT